MYDDNTYDDYNDSNMFIKYNQSKLLQGLKKPVNWNALVDDYTYILKTIQPDIIVTPYPLLDRNNIHKLSTIALLESIKKNNIKKGKLFLYTNHLVPNESYPLGESGSIISLPANFNGNINVDSIYSQSLSQKDQNDKYLALEAMSDLRGDIDWHFTNGLTQKFLQLRLFINKDILNKDFTYYRRSVRKNELFYVVDVKKIYDENFSKRITGVD